jgi:hypothetical protein
MAESNAVLFPREGQGFRAEVKIGEDIHLVLFATHSSMGPGASVFDAKTKRWFSNREWADDFDDAKGRAERIARNWYRHVGRKDPFPVLDWKETG